MFIDLAYSFLAFKSFLSLLRMEANEGGLSLQVLLIYYPSALGRQGADFFSLSPLLAFDTLRLLRPRLHSYSLSFPFPISFCVSLACELFLPF